MNPLRAIPVAAAVAALLMAAAPVAAAPASKASSGPLTTPLVELYTSEGCDSCPPADRWLSDAFPRTVEAAKPLALAFHVDYWDRLGWTDRFATEGWTERQYASMRANKATFVYTPQLLLQGHDFAAWRRGNTKSALDEVARRPARANLELAATVDGADVRVTATGHVADVALRRQTVVVIAYTDSGLVSDVKAGENRGVRLTHDHVVRALKTGAGAAADGSLQFAAGFKRPAEAGTAPAIVAFVQNVDNGEILQAVALPLAACQP